MKKNLLFTGLGILLALIGMAVFSGRGDVPLPAVPPPAPVAEQSVPAAKQAPTDPEAMPVSVTNAALMDSSILARKKPIVITFSDAMVKTEDVDKPLAAPDMPFTIHPAIEGEGRWLTDRSVAFMASRDFRPGKKYVLRFHDTLTSLDGRPVRYLLSFRTEAPKVKRVFPGAYNADAASLVINLDFDRPVRAKALASHLVIRDAESGETLEYGLLPESGTDAGAEREQSDFSLEAKLEKYRSKITVTIAPDADTDEHPFGYQKPYSVNFALPDPKSGEATASVEGTGEEGSRLRMYDPYGGEDDNGRLTASFSFNESLAGHEQKEFIEVKPALPYTFNWDASGLRFQEKLEPGMQISVTLKPGLTDASGRVLKKSLTRTHTVQDYESAVRFAEPGHYLTPVYGGRVPLDLVNVQKVTVSLHRQYDNNLSFMSLDPDGRVQEMMRSLVFKEITLKDVKLNEVQRRALDLEELAPGRRGVFMLTVTGYSEYKDDRGVVRYSYAGSNERLVVLTDIGVTARTFPSGVTVFATSLSTADPLADAEVKVYSRSNQLIAWGVTDKDGLFTHQRDEKWDDQLKPAVVTVRSKTQGEGQSAEGVDDLTFLALGWPSELDLEDPARRDYLESGYEAFLYTPRGVFRPGETVDVKAIVRDREHQAPSPFPVMFRIFSARNLELTRGSATLSEEGGAHFSFTLPTSAPTGDYRVTLEIPGQKDRKIGAGEFSVEDFVPPRLEVAVSPGEERFTADAALPVNLSGQYLFGAPGAGLRYELGYRVSLKDFSPEGWEGYIFGNGESKFSTRSHLDYLSGELDEQGLDALEFKAPSDWQPPALLRVLLVGSVQEDSGRWTSQTGTATWFPTPYLLGMKLDGEHLVPGEAGNIRIAAVDPDGKTVETGRLKAEISLVRSNWHTVYRDGRYIYTWNERIVPESSRSLESSGGQAVLEFTPRQRGTYLVRVSTEDGSVVASRRLNAWSSGESWDEDGNGRMDAVELGFDKKAYRPGDVARLTLKAPYAGTLLLGLERERQLSTRVLTLDQPAAVLEIPVTEDMDPNISVTAWVIRPVRAENKEWYAHRAYGMIGLQISKEPYTLKVAAGAPERAAPSAPLSVPFTVTDEQGTPVEGEFSVALVDEGILSLTAFRTPDPVSFFFERRRAVGKSYDGFDALLRPEARATPLLKAGGGASAEDYQGSLSTEQIFLAAFLPTVKTDANGQGLAEFAIPEYSGKGRLMVVGASENRFASADTNIRFARDLVVEAGAPRAVAPGDAFDFSVKLFAMPGGDPLQGEALLRVSVTGPLTLSGDLEKTIPLGPALASAAQTENGAPGAAAAEAPAETETAAETSAADNAEASAAGNTAAASPADGAREPAVSGRSGASVTTHTLALSAAAKKEAGVAAITVEVLVPGREDLNFSKRLEVVVRPPYPRTSAATAVLVREGEERTLTVPGAWLEGNLRSTFSVDKSPALAVLPMLEYLREYPYGCLEQVTSRAWPYLTLESVQRLLLSEESEDAAREAARTILADAVSRILAMQTSDGGFTAWPGYVTPAPWRSVNAAFLLVEAKAKTPVPAAALESIHGYLRLVLAAPVESLGGEAVGYSTKAYAAFVLTRAGQAPLGWIQHLSEQQDKLLPSGHIFLAGAKALKAGNTNALKELDSADLDLARVKPGHYGTFESELRNKSLLLYLWSELGPSDPKTTELCLDVATRITKARWYSTQEAGMASMAIGAYLRHTGAKNGAYSVRVTPEGGASADITNGEAFLSASRGVPLKEDGTAPSVKVKALEGQAWCIYNLRGTPMEPPAPASEGLTVQRVWKRPDGTVIDLSSGTARLKKGDRVIVELTVTANRPVHDVALSDLLPGGMEVENPRLKANAASESEDEDVDSGSGNGMFIDMREDRLLVFFDRVYKEATYSYSLRAVTKGSFALPPLAADAMYDPAFNAVTADGMVTVE